MDASDRKQVRKAEKAAKAQEKQREGVVHNLMSTIAGRAFVHDILHSTGVFVPTFNLNGLAMANNEGQRLVGLRFLTEINNNCPDKYVLMIREYNERHANDSDRGSTSGELTGGEDGDGRIEGRDPDAPDPHGYYR